jgi:GDP-L-fucose synthase
MERDSAVFVAGHRGLVGSAIVRHLSAKGFSQIITRSHEELDLLDQASVRSFFKANRIDYVFLAAAKVGGILHNKLHQADFLYENLLIAANVIEAAARTDVTKLLYLGSSCIYPKHAGQPIKEEYLLTGPLEPTNEGYALAKIAGLKLCEKFREQYGKSFISVMPTNLYGPGDNFHPDHSHVIPGMMRRFHDANQRGLDEVVIWGSGTPRREFLYVDDLAEALVCAMENYDEPTTLNVGCGRDCTILELAETMQEIVGFSGDIRMDPSKPDGTPRKVLDVTRIRTLGWEASTSLKDGLARTYRWAKEQGRL